MRLCALIRPIFVLHSVLVNDQNRQSRFKKAFFYRHVGRTDKRTSNVTKHSKLLLVDIFMRTPGKLNILQLLNNKCLRVGFVVTGKTDTKLGFRRGNGKKLIVKSRRAAFF